MRSGRGQSLWQLLRVTRVLLIPHSAFPIRFSSAFQASAGFIPAGPQLVSYRHTITHCRSRPQRTITPARLRD